MISYRITTEEIQSLEGLIIFHAEKGSHVSAILMPFGTIKVGVRLGKVVRVSGPNRIFYKKPDGEEGYVSVAGIGFICQFESEAKSLEKIRDEANDKICEYTTVVNAEMKLKLDFLLHKAE